MPKRKISSDKLVAAVPGEQGLAELRAWCDAVVEAGCQDRWGAWSQAGDGKVRVYVGRHDNAPVHQIPVAVYTARKCAREAAEGDSRVVVPFRAATG